VRLVARRVAVALSVGACSPAPPPTEVVFIQPAGERAPERAREVKSSSDGDASHPAQTPKQALASFVRAYEDRRYDLILRFTPNEALAGEDALDERKLRQAWEGPQREEIEHTMTLLRAALASGAPIELVGEEQAAMAYGHGRTVSLMLEDGVWKIRDF
jgi:hypothetical protein